MSDPDMRHTIASAVAVVLSEEFLNSTVRQTETTSGCPIVEVTIAGVQYNLTITRAR